MKNLFVLICIGFFSNSAIGQESSTRVRGDQTFIDFSEAVIEGKMKAPEGFYLQGRKGQIMKQMVKLRSNFRDELRNSKASVETLSK